MAFQLEGADAVLDERSYDVQKEINTDKHYFGERVPNVGILNFGYVRKDEERQISLSANGINSPITIDSIIAFAPTNTSDEIFFYLYTTYNGQIVKLGTQKFTNSDMPIKYPTNVIFPDMVIGVKPTKADTTIVLYAKPVNILFDAVPNP